MFKYFKTIFILFIISMTCAYAEKLISFQDPNSKLHGFKNGKGKIIIPAQFQAVSNSEKDELLIPVIKNGTFYRMDKKGNLKFESVFYDNGWDYYEEGVARFLRDAKVGFHDKAGNIIIQPQYDFAQYFKNGHSAVCNGCWAYYPKSPRWKPLSSGKEITIQEQYKSITGGKWGIINIKGEVIVPLEYDSYEAAMEKLKIKK